jgi:hypothetical protein
MNEREFAAALNILRTIMRRPAAAPFCGNSDLGFGSPFFGGGFGDRPNLTVILSRLTLHQYDTFLDWEKAVQQVFVSFGEISPGHEILASRLEKVFFSEKRKTMIFPDLLEWSTEICRLRDKLGRLTYCPPRITALALAGLDPKQSLDSQLQKDSDYQNFLMAMGKLTNLDDQEALLRLIEAEQPELACNEQKVEINILDLKPRTFMLAKEFLKKRLKMLNIDCRGLWDQ